MAAGDKSKTQLVASLNIMLRDAANNAYSDAEKQESISRAINDDPWVFIVDRDNTTVVKANTVSYSLPDGFDDLLELRVDNNGTGFGTPLDIGSWSVINGTLYLDYQLSGLPVGKALIMIGRKKLYDTDLIPEWMQSYILHNAAAWCMELLTADKTGRFLKNDTTMSELITAINNHRTTAIRLRSTLPNRHNIKL